MAGQLHPFAAWSGEGGRLVFGGRTIVVRVSAETTGGVFTMFEESAPLLDTSGHVHAHEDEMYYVVEGAHVYQCGDEQFRVGPGDVVFLPRAIPHAHRRVVPEAGRLIFMTFPGGFAGFFRILAEASRAGEPGEAAYALGFPGVRHHLGEPACTAPTSAASPPAPGGCDRVCWPT